MHHVYNQKPAEHFCAQILPELIFSICMGLFSSMCSSMFRDHAFFYMDPTGTVRWLLIALGYATGYFALVFLMETEYRRTISADVSKAGKIDTLPVKKYSTNCWNKQHFWVRVSVFFFCWLPYLIIFRPGLANYDTINQVNDVFNGISPVPFGFVGGQETVNAFLNDHHPFLVSLLFAAFFRAGEMLGSASYGMTMYCICQMILGAVIFSYVIETMEVLHVRKSWRVVSLLFYALMPFVPFYMICMLKNTLHTLLFVLYFTLYVRFICISDSHQFRVVICLCVLSAALCLTQKTGVYLIIVSDAALLIPIRRNARSAKSKPGSREIKIKKTELHNTAVILSTIILCSLMMFVILPKIVFPAFHIFPGGRQEALSTLFQQTARVVYDHEDQLTEEDKEIINSVLDYDRIKSDFSYTSTDPVKATFKLHSTPEEQKEYLKWWFKTGFRFPESYLKATLTVICGYFIPVTGIDIYDHIPIGSGGYFDQIVNTGPPGPMSAVSGWYHHLRDTPVIRVLLSNALYCWIIPMVTLFLMIRKKRKCFVLALVPIGMWTLFMLVSPMIYSRYVLPQIMLGVFLLSWNLISGCPREKTRYI